MSAVRNVVVFVADHLRADHLGFAGGQVPTPHLDELAREAVVFDNAHVANPTCMPNRSTIVTGRWPTAHGTRTNGITLDFDAQTLMRSMQRARWRTGAVGKLHFQTMGWPYEEGQRAEIDAFDPGLLDEAIPDAAPRSRPQGWDSWEDRDRHAPAYLPMPSDYYGFDDVDLVIGHGDHPGGHYAHWARDRGVDPQQVRALVEEATAGSSWDQVYCSPVPQEFHPTSYVTERALARLEEYAASADPFMLFVSYPDPHHPFAPPEQLWHQRPPDQLQLPDSFFDEGIGSPAHIRGMLRNRGMPALDPTMVWSPTEQQFRDALSAELGLISMLDDSMGSVLARLDALGLADDTAVVFTSDHGDMFGDHGLMLKHFVHYRGVTRVPLMLRVPGVDARRTDALVSSADIAPTLLGLGGLPRFRGIQGLDLGGVLRGQDSVRPHLLIEEDQPFGMAGLPGPVRMRSLITQTARLTTYAGTTTRELYDLDADPDERVNLASSLDGAQLEADLMSRLANELTEVADTGVRPVASA